MSNLRSDSYCGLYCGACEIVHAKTEEAKHNVIQMFESNISGWRASLDQMHCSGCKSDDVFVNCAKCPIKPCARAKGIEFCFECADYPCKLHRFLRAASEQVPVLRHLKVIESNQGNLRAHGLSAWLKIQEEVWKCPKCGTAFSWYTVQCSRCGHVLKGMKDFERA
jgi:hypothetical protein